MIRRLLGLDALDSAIEISEHWRDLSGHYAQCLKDDRLEYARLTRSHIENFLLVLERPETQDRVREELLKALEDLNDQVARLEEHVT